MAQLAFFSSTSPFFKQLIDNFSVAFGHHPAIAKNPTIVQFG